MRSFLWLLVGVVVSGMGHRRGVQPVRVVACFLVLLGVGAGLHKLQASDFYKYHPVEISDEHKIHTNTSFLTAPMRCCSKVQTRLSGEIVCHTVFTARCNLVKSLEGE